MEQEQWLAERFEADRTRLRAVAYRMLGSRSEADDAVQEAWLRLSRSDISAVENLSGWLTAVVSRVCLDMLRSHASRREEPLDLGQSEPLGGREQPNDTERELLLADSIGLALLVVLETLTPAERVAFVLHDMFDLPFDEIAPIVGRSATAARQLASRARRRVRGATPAGDTDRARQRQVVDAFLAASRGGDFNALLGLLDPEVVLQADDTAVRTGAAAEVRGATDVAKIFAGRARAARPALVNGAPGLVWAPGGRPRVVFHFAVAGGRIIAIHLVADPEQLGELDLVVLDDRKQS
ncbi:MAG TPA: sigma-70 family RNA polymerase sigma factor [Gemmatimonadales bacterium]|jgi:RNA polymerase sigma-70 factor (ECF subfamily)